MLYLKPDSGFNDNKIDHLHKIYINFRFSIYHFNYMGLSIEEITLIICVSAIFILALYLLVQEKPVDIYWLVIIIVFNPLLGPAAYIIRHVTRKYFINR